MVGVMRSVRSIAHRLRRERIVQKKNVTDLANDVSVLFISRNIRDIRQIGDQNVLLMTTICVFAVKNDVFQANMCHSTTMPTDFDMFDPINSKKTLVSKTDTVIYSYSHGDEINIDSFFPRKNSAPNTNRRYLDIKLVFQFDKSDVRVEEYLDIIAEYKDIANGKPMRRINL
jgi:hypothetical protein